MKKQLMYWMAAVIVLIIGCQKELSFEGPGTPAKGSLQFDVTGDCLPKTVNGIYAASAALVPATNTITVQVNVTQTGTYVVTTDTVNGYFFRATGTFTALGMTTVTLRGNGTPFAAGTDNFVVSFDGTICDIAVTVVPAGTGAAVYTANCAGATVSGTYQVGTNLTASNTIVIPITVATAGTYSITASVNGMTFSGSGSLTTSSTSITLNGVTTTTPLGPAGSYTLVVGSCNIPITVTAGAGAAIYTMNCALATVSGTYTAGTALTASNTITIPITVATAGTYNISTAPAVNGMIFTGSGTLTLASTSITLSGVGSTPLSGGISNITVGSCTIPITVSSGSTLAVCSLIGNPGNCTAPTVSGIYVVGGTLTSSHTVTVGVNVITAGTYNVTTTAAGGGLTFSGTGSVTTSSTSITLTATAQATVAGNNSFTVSVNGSASCTFTIYVLPNDYYPRTTNSNWSYEFDNVATDSLYRTATTTTSILSNTYTIFMQNDGTGLDSGGYYRRSGSDYFEWFDFGSWIGLDNPAWTQYTMLMEGNAVNTPWISGTVSGTVNSGAQPISVRFQYQILQKNVPITITSSGSPATVTYQDVIVVEEKIWYNIGAGWVDGTTLLDYYGKSYYARGVGLIKFEAFDATNVLLGQQELRRFQIF